MEITAQAPAKINRFIHITGQRPDGYHLIQSVFQLIGLYDLLHFKISAKKGLTLTCNQPIPLEENLIFRAYQLLEPLIIAPEGVDITITKHIPIGAGLGGGSSDAATTLLALNELFELKLTTPELLTLASKLGADVPFFTQGENAWVEGIGEKLTPITLEPCFFLVVIPAIGIPTARIYQEKALTRNHESIKMDSFFSEQVTNVFEPVVRSIYPQVAMLLDALKPYKGRLTGTGSACFASFNTEEDANQVAMLFNDLYQCFVVRSLDCSPKHRIIRV